MYYRMDSKLYPRTKSLLSFLSHNNLIDDSTSQEILNTLDTIKKTNDKDLLWDSPGTPGRQELCPNYCFLVQFSVPF